MSRSARNLALLLAPLLGLALALPQLPASRADVLSPAQARPAPEFTGSGADDWINSRPLRLADLNGRVVLLDVWTYGCWNCTRSIPWLKDLETRLAPRGLRVVGIHSPEFEHERDAGAVRAKAREFGLAHPIMLDNDFRYWRALNNRYWPAFYLVDRHGRLRAGFVGETHKDTPQARRIETALEKLLAE